MPNDKLVYQTIDWNELDMFKVFAKDGSYKPTEKDLSIAINANEPEFVRYFVHELEDMNKVRVTQSHLGNAREWARVRGNQEIVTILTEALQRQNA